MDRPGDRPMRNRMVNEDSCEDEDTDGELLYAAPRRKPQSRARLLGLSFCFFASVGLMMHGLLREWTDAGVLNVVTWNIAAINNNPFEYWITHDDADYNKLMEDVQTFIDAPGERDVRVSQVFTPAMFGELKALMGARQWPGLDAVEERWTGDFSQRKIISGFLKDHALGEKRLTSMPDRVTNTINVAGGGVANRPTVINCFGGDMSSVPHWWAEWKGFMFEKALALPGRDGGVTQTIPASMLAKIKRSKYPAITEAEENISVPLQTLAQAIFDAVLVHVVNSVSPGAKWQRLQQQMCDALNRRKNERTLAILARTYSDATLIFLQETASVFVKTTEAHPTLASRFFLAKAATLDAKRDQNSIVLLSRAFFNEATLAEHTSAVMGGFDKSVPIADGDLLVVSVDDLMGRKYLLASFHGDTNGLATLPVLAALHKLALTMPEHRLVFGLDANTYEVGSSSKQGVSEFATAFVLDGYTSCWGDQPDPKSDTTYNARTFLQPQLQKAARIDEKVSKGDKNPKDFILFSKNAFTLQAATKDNTGERRYVKDIVFPTLSFPSDHGIVAASLAVR